MSNEKPSGNLLEAVGRVFLTLLLFGFVFIPLYLYYLLVEPVLGWLKEAAK